MDSIEPIKKNKQEEIEVSVSPEAIVPRAGGDETGALALTVQQNEERASKLDEALVERYFGANNTERVLDPTIIDYFRHHLGPEETMTRLKRMDPDSQERVKAHIEAGDVEKVVDLMEDHHIQGTEENLKDEALALEEKPPGSDEKKPDNLPDWTKHWVRLKNWKSDKEEAVERINQRKLNKEEVLRKLTKKLN